MTSKPRRNKHNNGCRFYTSQPSSIEVEKKDELVNAWWPPNIKTKTKTIFSYSLDCRRKL